MKKTVRIIMIGLFIAAASSVQAGDFNTSAGLVYGSFDDDMDAFGIRVTGGYDLNKYFEPQAMLTYLGGGSDVTDEYFDALVLSILGKGKYPITDQFGVYALLGLSYGTPVSGDNDDDDFGISYGLGAEYSFGERFAAYVDYMVYVDEDVYVNGLSLGVLYRF